jgi:DNA-binding PadR family transcriptional regulator
LIRTIILGLLRERPMHGYEIQQYIQMSQMERWANVLSGSIYYALNKMEQEELIRTEAEERTGARLRKIYAITEKGEKAFKDSLVEALSAPVRSLKSDFFVALGWIDELPKEECIRLLRKNIEKLEENKHYWKIGRTLKGKYGLPPAIELAFENVLELIELDIRFLNNLIQLVDQGKTGTKESRIMLNDMKLEEES